MKPAMVAGMCEQDWTNFEPFYRKVETISCFGDVKINELFLFHY